ncbi:hypothetical protein K2X40_03475 [Candidatus Babeliales bacterium]|nr:hypothetical protein [Candidatus Babeliales bacterium]
MKKVVWISFIFFCVGDLFCYGVSAIKTIFKVRPELYVFVKTGVSVTLVDAPEYVKAACVHGVVSLYREAEIADVVVAVNLAYSLHFASLLENDDEKTVQRHVLYELLSKHYALSYLSSFSRAQQERYQEIIGNESSLEKRLIVDFRNLVNSNASAAEKAQLIGAYLFEHYEYAPDVEIPISAAVQQAIDVLPLAVPAHMLMTQGGDDRLFVSPQTGLNKYYTSPLPTTDVVMRSSCTSSCPTMYAYKRTELMRRALLKNALQSNLEQCFDLAMHNLRARLKNYFGVDSSCAVTTPSGSDAEMIITLLALMRHPLWRAGQLSSGQPLVTTILTAAGEVGSLSYLGATCSHLSSYLPSGGCVQAGTSLAGIPAGAVQGVQIGARNHVDGGVNSLVDVEQQIEQLLARVISQENQIAVVHLVHFSKTGLSVPSFDFVKRMKKLYERKLIIVVDAAQSRCDDNLIRTYLDEQFNVFITGSKFFAGPPFSGLVLLAHDEAQELMHVSNAAYVPTGLSDYFTGYDADGDLQALRLAFAKRSNYGLWLRLEAVYAEMERFALLDTAARDQAIAQWVAGVRSLARSSKYMSLLEDRIPDNTSCVAPLLGQSNSVISLVMFLDDGTTLDYSALQRVHYWLTQDISRALLACATDDEVSVARKKFLIGQPVKLTSAGSECAALRIALSSAMICAMAQTPIVDSVCAMLKNDEQIIQKLTVILRYYAVLQEYLGVAQTK